MKNTSQPLSKQTAQLVHTLKWRYFIALALMAAVALVSQIAVQFALHRSFDDADLINKAGRQRMLSQKLAKNIAYSVAGVSFDFLANIDKDLSLWENSHDEIFRKTPQWHELADQDPKLVLMINQIEGYFTTYDSLIKSLISKYPKLASSQELSVLQNAESIFLETMDAIVFAYSDLVTKKIAFLQFLEFILFIGVFAILSLEALLIFSPSLKYISQSINQQLITENVQLHTQRLIQLGTIFAGIGHQILTPITYIISNLELAIDSLESNSDYKTKVTFKPLMKDALSGVMRVSQLVKGLMHFAAHSRQSNSSFLLYETANEAARILSYNSNQNIEIENKIPKNLTMHGKEVDWLQIFVNLIQNSIDAIKSQKNYNSKFGKVCIEASKNNQETFVTITDNGPGVPAELQPKIFEPFFSTKTVGDRLGLGLSMVLRIVEDVQGTLVLDKKYSDGARFIIQVTQANFGSQIDTPNNIQPRTDFEPS